MLSQTFKIHIINKGEEVIIDSFDKEMIKELGVVILIGDEFKYLKEFFTNDFNSEKLCKEREVISKDISLINKFGEKQSYKLEIKGWIGAYKSTRGKKSDKSNFSDFPDNFISLFANGKLGEFNILPNIAKNKLYDVFIVGQLHIDLFEETTLPDMALSNRQGYKTDDERYVFVINEATALLEEVTNMRALYAKLQKNEKKKEASEKLSKKESELKDKVEQYHKQTSDRIVTNIKEVVSISTQTMQEVKNIIKQETKKIEKIIGIKQDIDKAKKKILISQTKKDKALADIVCSMLEFNNVPLEDILYTNNDDPITHIPIDEKIYDYLQKFFVDSLSSQKIYVIYITSQNMSQSWGCLMEAGAGWITKSDYCIFNINNYKPKEPLNNGKEWHNSTIENGHLIMDKRSKNVFIEKILHICHKLEYKGKTQKDNLNKLNTLL